MLNYTVRRILLTFPTMLAVLTLVFFLVRVAPGDPAMAILGTHASQELLDALRKEMGLDVSFWMQYIKYLRDLARGNLGISMLSGYPVKDQLFSALPYTLELAFSSMVIGTVFGIPLGVLAALRRNKTMDYFGRVASLFGISVPSFYLGILLLFFFSVKLNLFPVVGGSGADTVRDRVYHLFLPALSLGLMLTSYLMRVTRSTMLNVLNEDFVRTAKAKGLHMRGVIYKHTLANALIPIVSVMGIYFIIDLGGSVMIEIVFSRPGLGKLMVMAMKQRDYVMLQSVMVMYAMLAILINLFVDVICGFLDPRIKYK